MKKALFFDMDGTLIDSMELHVESWIKSLKSKNLNTSKEDLLKLGGVSFVDTIHLVAKRNNTILLESEVLEIHNLKVEYMKTLLSTAKVYPVISQLSEFKRKGIFLALVTSSDKSSAIYQVGRFFEGIFDIVLCSEDFVKKKPDPEPYLKALSLSGCKKEDCFVIEDAPAGILSGNSAGIETLGILTSNTREELSSATRIFETHKELFDFISKKI